MKRFFIYFLFLFIPFQAAASETVHVAYNIDDKYVIYTLLSINSILKNNKSNSDYTFWILGNGISEKNKKMMIKYIEKRHQKIQFLSLKEDTLYQSIFPLIKNIFNYTDFAHVSYVSFMRLFIPSLLPDDVHKVVYIDGDTLANQDVSKLFQTDLGEFPIGMVKDISQDLKKICNTNAYYNAGVVLINVDKWKKDDTLGTILSIFKENPSKYQRYAEQDLLNCVFDGKIKTLDAKWNNQVFRYLFTANYDDTGIFHYLSGEKPWKVFGAGALYRPYRIYYSYWNYSGLRRYKYKAIFDEIKNMFTREKKMILKDMDNLKYL